MVPVNVKSSNSASGFNSQSAFSEQSEFASESSLEPSYVALKMASDNGSKRQKRADSLQTGGLFDPDNSHELERDLHDATFNNYSDDLYQQNRGSGAENELRRQSSIENFAAERQQNTVVYDDMFLERAYQPSQQRNSSLFFGLAIVFAGLGVMTSMDSTSINETMGMTVVGNSGMGLRNSAHASIESSSIIHQDEEDPIEDSVKSSVFEVDTNSPFETM